MAISVKTNALVGPAVAGDSATTDPGFQPKGLILWSGLQTAIGSLADAQWSLGVAGSSTTERSAGWNSDDGTASSDNVRYFSTTEILKNMTAGSVTVNNAATLASFDATGFTTNWATLNTALPEYNYFALGGADVTNVETGSFAANASTGNQSVVLSGAFQPDVVFFFVTLLTAAGVGNNNSQYGLGVMDSGGRQWAIGGKAQNAQTTTNTSRLFYNTRCLAIPLTTTNGVFFDMSYVSMNSNGFTVNIDTSDGTQVLIGYMAIKGGQWFVGTDTQKTSTGTKTTTGIGFTPEAVLFGSVCDTQTAGTADNYRLVFGAADGTRNTCLWAGDGDNQANAVADTIMSSTKCVVLATEGTPTTNAEADIDSFGSGEFTLDWTTADATARVFGFVACASNSSGSAIKTIDGLAKASVKTVDDLAIASVKTFNGLA